MKSLFIIKHGLTEAFWKYAGPTWHPRSIDSFVLKTSNANLEFAVIFSITQVFLRQFLNFGKARSKVSNPIGSEPFKSLADSDAILSTKKARLMLTEQSFSSSTLSLFVL